MVSKSIIVFEHSTLYVGEKGFTANHYRSLLKFNDLHGNKYFIPGLNKVTFKSHVGVIQVGDKTIEILPKADKFPISEEQVVKWQSALLYMLKKSGLLKLNSPEKATQKEHKSDLLDIYLYSFLNEVERLIHLGLIKKYHRVVKNQTVLKGRLLMGKQILLNNVHKERFYTEFTTYDRNNQFNSIIKMALQIIFQTSRNNSIKQLAARNLLSFENLDNWNGTEKDFSKLLFDRKTNGYRQAIEIAKMIILNYCPDIKSGTKQILAILFDMNRLFEKYIYRILKKEEQYYSTSFLKISSQTNLSFWKQKSIKPDIVLQYIDDSNELQKIIIDTKWKVIDEANPSDNDLKQVYVYNLQFGARRSILFYPFCGQKNSGINNYSQSLITSQFEHGCELYFADLFEKGTSKMNDVFSKTFLDYIVSNNGNKIKSVYL
jgi:5-methylcytosine-specific restriction enzyme subunit McrC